MNDAIITSSLSLPSYGQRQRSILGWNFEISGKWVIFVWVCGGEIIHNYSYTFTFYIVK